VCRMVESRVGIAVVPETAATRCRRTMALSALQLTDTWAVRKLIVCVRRKEALPAHTRRLVEHLAGKPKQMRNLRIRIEITSSPPVYTENPNTGVVVMKSAQDGK